jgi:hypothetical protein
MLYIEGCPLNGPNAWDRERSKDGSPEDDLGHGIGIAGINVVSVLRWTLNEASVMRLNGNPYFTEIKHWIDSNRQS